MTDQTEATTNNLIDTICCHTEFENAKVQDISSLWSYWRETWDRRDHLGEFALDGLIAVLKAVPFDTVKAWHERNEIYDVLSPGEAHELFAFLKIRPEDCPLPFRQIYRNQNSNLSDLRRFVTEAIVERYPVFVTKLFPCLSDASEQDADGQQRQLSSPEPSLLAEAADRGETRFFLWLLERLIPIDIDTETGTRDQFSSRLDTSSDWSKDLVNQLSLRFHGEHTVLTKAVMKGHIRVVKAILEFAAKFQINVVEGQLFSSAKVLFESLTTLRRPGLVEKDSADILDCLITNGVSLTQEYKEKLFDDCVASQQDLLMGLLIQSGQRDFFTPKVICTLLTTAAESVWTKCVDRWRALTRDSLWAVSIEMSDTKRRRSLNTDSIEALGSRDDNLDGSTATAERKRFEFPAENHMVQAVASKRVFVIRDMIQEYPSLASRQLPSPGTAPGKAADGTSSSSKKYLLSEVSAMVAKWDQADEDCVAMRDYLVEALILDSSERVEEVVRSCKIAVNQFSLNMSTIDTQQHDFKQIVESLTEKRQARQVNQIRFEKVLSMAKFPQLMNSTCDPDGQDRSDHSEIMDTLCWLGDKMCVRHIQSLIVRDRAERPHDWEVIHACIKKFQVKNLDWRSLNVCLSDCNENAFDRGALQRREPGSYDGITNLHSLESLESLCLYTNGDMNTIHQWFGPEGLVCLRKLQSLEINLVHDMLSESRAEKIESYLRNRLKHIEFPKLLTKTVETCSWLENDAKGSVDHAFKNRVVQSFGAKLGLFISKYNEIHTRAENPRASHSYTRTKIALIDDGVMCIGHAGIGKQVETGESFVVTQPRCLWFLGSEGGHGTQMAAIIASLDPQCRLYVAQVKAPGHSLSIPVITKAIKWAIEKQVDIISLSLALHRRPDTETRELQAAIDEAEANNVVVICSTMDDGRNVSISDTLPAGCNYTLPIVACDRHGGTLPYSQTTSSNAKIYHVRGDGLTVGQLEYVNGPLVLQGSSVSTAVAAGLASLILSCGRIARRQVSATATRNGNEVMSNLTDSDERGWSKGLVVQKFDTMKDPDGGSYVRPDFLCGKESIHPKSTADEILELIALHFRYVRN